MLKTSLLKISFLVEKGNNPVDLAWGQGRPAKPENKIRFHDDSVAGKTVAEKLASVREKMKAAGAG